MATAIHTYPVLVIESSIIFLMALCNVGSKLGQRDCWYGHLVVPRQLYLTLPYTPRDTRHLSTPSSLATSSSYTPACPISAVWMTRLPSSPSVKEWSVVILVPFRYQVKEGLGYPVTRTLKTTSSPSTNSESEGTP